MSRFLAVVGKGLELRGDGDEEGSARSRCNGEPPNDLLRTDINLSAKSKIERHNAHTPRGSCGFRRVAVIMVRYWRAAGETLARCKHPWLR